MAKPKPGMGRGLSAILSVSAEGAADRRASARAAARATSRRIRTSRAARSTRRRSRRWPAHSGEQGVLQPVLVRPRPGGRYELVAGERRWRAAQIAGLKTIPALIRDREDAASLEVALVENMAREDLSPVEEARACAALVEELGLTREEVGLRVGRSRVAVSNLIRLLDLPDEVLDLLQAGALSEGHGRALLLAEDHARRRRLAASAAKEGWSVRVTEERARAANEREAGTAAAEPPPLAAPRPGTGRVRHRGRPGSRDRSGRAREAGGRGRLPRRDPLRVTAGGARPRRSASRRRLTVAAAPAERLAGAQPQLLAGSRPAFPRAPAALGLPGAPHARRARLRPDAEVTVRTARSTVLGLAERGQFVARNVRAQMMDVPVVLAQGNRRHQRRERVPVAFHPRDRDGSAPASARRGMVLPEEPLRGRRRPVLDRDRQPAGAPLVPYPRQGGDEQAPP